jgi:hypothetical protein
MLEIALTLIVGFALGLSNPPFFPAKFSYEGSPGQRNLDTLAYTGLTADSLLTEDISHNGSCGFGGNADGAEMADVAVGLRGCARASRGRRRL